MESETEKSDDNIDLVSSNDDIELEIKISEKASEIFPDSKEGDFSFRKTQL